MGLGGALYGRLLRGPALGHSLRPPLGEESLTLRLPLGHLQCCLLRRLLRGLAWPRAAARSAMRSATRSARDGSDRAPPASGRAAASGTVSTMGCAGAAGCRSGAARRDWSSCAGRCTGARPPGPTSARSLGPRRICGLVAGTRLGLQSNLWLRLSDRPEARRYWARRPLPPLMRPLAAPAGRLRRTTGGDGAVVHRDVDRFPEALGAAVEDLVRAVGSMALDGARAVLGVNRDVGAPVEARGAAGVGVAPGRSSIGVGGIQAERPGGSIVAGAGVLAPGPFTGSALRAIGFATATAAGLLLGPSGAVGIIGGRAVRLVASLRSLVLLLGPAGAVVLVARRGVVFLFWPVPGARLLPLGVVLLLGARRIGTTLARTGHGPTLAFRTLTGAVLGPVGRPRAAVRGVGLRGFVVWIRALVGTVLGIVRRFAVRSTGGSTVRGSIRRGVRRYRLTIVRVCAGLIGVRAARSRVRAGYGAGLGARFRAGAGVGFGTRVGDGLLTGVAGGHGLGRADAEGRRTGVSIGGAVTVSFVDDRAAYLVVLLAAPGAGVGAGVGERCPGSYSDRLRRVAVCSGGPAEGSPGRIRSCLAPRRSCLGSYRNCRETVAGRSPRPPADRTLREVSWTARRRPRSRRSP